jgi:DNA-binding transcriptional regulator PaaX
MTDFKHRIPVDVATDLLAPRSFVETSRASHVEWAMLGMRAPSASALLHRMVVGADGAGIVRASHREMAAWAGCSSDTVKRALKVLVEDGWVSVRSRIPGAALTYALADRVLRTGDRRRSAAA